MIDLDYFKDVNDTYGHLRGDAVLREVASVITRCVREGDVVARYAGDEFAVILPATAEADALRIAERIRSQRRGRRRAWIDLPDDERVTLSIGVATRWPGEHTATRTVELADQALYHAKESGRNRVVGRAHDVTVLTSRRAASAAATSARQLTLDARPHTIRHAAPAPPRPRRR